MGKMKALILDGDDTLWETMSLYTEAKQAFATVLEAEGIPRKRALAVFEDTDLQNVKQYGFSRVRFPLWESFYFKSTTVSLTAVNPARTTPTLS